MANIDYALVVNHKCPRCGLSFKEPIANPNYICLHCGRIYSSEREAKDCICLFRYGFYNSKEEKASKEEKNP